MQKVTHFLFQYNGGYGSPFLDNNKLELNSSRQTLGGGILILEFVF